MTFFPLVTCTKTCVGLQHIDSCVDDAPTSVPLIWFYLTNVFFLFFSLERRFRTFTTIAYQGEPEDMDGRGEVAAGRGHRNVRRDGPDAAGGACAHQKGALRDSDAAGLAGHVPQGGWVSGYAAAEVRRPERDGWPVRGRRHPAARRHDQVDGLPERVLRQRRVPVREVQAVLPSVPDHVRVHATVDSHDARDDNGCGRQESRRLYRLQVSCRGGVSTGRMLRSSLGNSNLVGEYNDLFNLCTFSSIMIYPKYNLNTHRVIRLSKYRDSAEYCRSVP